MGHVMYPLTLVKKKKKKKEREDGRYPLSQRVYAL